MVFAGWGDMGLGSLQAGVGSALDAFKEAQRQRQLEALGQQIQTGDLTGAAATALRAGDLSTGLKLYELQQKQGDTAGLDEAFSKIMTPQGAAPAAPAVNIPGKVSALQNMGSMSYAGAAPGTTLPSGDVMAYAPAISGNEGTTGPGGYSQTGIVIPKTGDRAYGKYQVMGANIGPWTQEILGRSMTPEEFLASPEAQDAVYRGKFGQYTQKYGPVGAAKAWFAGERGMNNPNAIDPLGTTVVSYADNFQRRLGQPPSNAMAFAPAQAAISTATGRAPDGTPIDLAASTGPRRLGQPPAPVATSPDDETPDTPAFRPLGSPPTLPISPEARDLMQRRDQLLQLMPKAMRNPAYEKLLPAAINSLNQQITEAEARYKELNKGPLETAQRQWTAENVHHYKPGSDEWHQFISEGKVKSETEKAPQTFNAKDKFGNDITMVKKKDGTFEPVDVPTRPTDPSVPAGVDPKEYMKEKAKSSVKNEQATLDSQRSAKKVMPYIDDAIDAYQKLKNLGGLSPVQAWGPTRVIAGVLHSRDEAQRQNYERALNNINSMVNIFKGQGAVSDFERRLMMQRFPGLDALEGQKGLDQLYRMKEELMNASHDVYGSDPMHFDDGTSIQKIK
jgi:hypothetical protein